MRREAVVPVRLTAFATLSTGAAWLAHPELGARLLPALLLVGALSALLGGLGGRTSPLRAGLCALLAQAVAHFVLSSAVPHHLHEVPSLSMVLLHAAGLALAWAAVVQTEVLVDGLSRLLDWVVPRLGLQPVAIPELPAPAFPDVLALTSALLRWCRYLRGPPSVNAA